MLEPNIQPELYIFAAMDRNLGYSRLKEAANELPHIAQVKESGQCLWLLRESNTQPGMLTADFIHWDKENNRWLEKSTRMALHREKGWINASAPNNPEVKEALKSIHTVNAKSAGRHQESLTSYLSSFSPFNLLVQNRLNPSKSQQAQLSLYSQYTSHAKAAASSSHSKTPVLLTPDIIQAISCEISGKVLKVPVVLIRDITIANPEGYPMKLSKGKSYELAELQRLGVDSKDYYPNFVLQKIISRLGSNDAGLIEKLETERLIDPVLLETLADPYILPSGHSLSKASIDGIIASGRSLRCPQTQLPFTKENIVRNVNLTRFIEAWPNSRAALIKSLSEKSTTSTKPKL